MEKSSKQLETSEKPQSNGNENVITNATYIKIASILFAAAGIAAIVVSTLSGSTDPCMEIRRSSTNGLQRNTCPEVECDFDVSLCSFSCPFGYEMDRDRCPVSCKCAVDTNSFQGDIQIDETQLPRFLKVYGYEEDDEYQEFSLQHGSALTPHPYINARWNEDIEDQKNVIYFEMDRAIKSVPGAVKAIKEGHGELEKQSCFKFKPYLPSSDSSYIKYIRDNGCWSKVGKLIRPGTGQDLSIGSGCDHWSTVAHELLHAFGFDHEQCRPDRDEYIIFHSENLQKGSEIQFEKIPLKFAVDLGSSYDFDSLMHYGEKDFSSNGKVVLEKLPDTKTKGVPDYRDDLSEEDVKELNALYCKNLKIGNSGGSTGGSGGSTSGSGGSTGGSGGSTGGSGGSTGGSGGTTGGSGSSTGGSGGTTGGSGGSTSGSGGSTGGSGSSTGGSGGSTSGSGGSTGGSGSTTGGSGGTTGGSGGSTGGSGGSTGGSGSSTGGSGGSTGGSSESIRWGGFGPYGQCTCTSAFSFARRTCIGGTYTQCRKKFPNVSLFNKRKCVANHRPTTCTSAQWGPWGSYGRCSRTCGTYAFRQRERDCPAGYGKCYGVSASTIPCTVPRCTGGGSTGGGTTGGGSTGGGTTGGGSTGGGTTGGGSTGGGTTGGGSTGGGSTGGGSTGGGSTGGGSTGGGSTGGGSTGYTGPKHWGQFGPWSKCRCTNQYILSHRSCVYGTITDCEYHYPNTYSFRRKKCADSDRPSNCQSPSQWSPWTAYGQCTRTCGDNSYQIRSRTCQGVVGTCVGKTSNAIKCNVPQCTDARPQWSAWYESVPCTKSCGGGWKWYRRHCLKKESRTGTLVRWFDKDCPGGTDPRTTESAPLSCNTQPCISGRVGLYSEEPMIKMFRRTPIKPLNNPCPASKTLRWVFGDFNGDLNQDAMCGEDSGIFHILYGDTSGRFAALGWSGYMQDCSRGAKYSADFNGDGLDDLLCQDKEKKLLSVKLSENAVFDADAVFESYFCTGASDEVILLDANADGKADILCNHGRSRIEILHSK
ncbi:uncharacterized protein LOC143470493 isoform X2 [Clavelina lepadiformis]|uniref:uncharacterized protein LOC143470493 isoform X2 n=1 Tax=Clavelina lepadiformis TaxID=159417 RepID=UPI0040419DF4